MFPLLGDAASAERGRQTGFPNPLLGKFEPLVNSPGSGGRTPVEWLIDWPPLRGYGRSLPGSSPQLCVPFEKSQIRETPAGVSRKKRLTGSPCSDLWLLNFMFSALNNENVTNWAEPWMQKELRHCHCSYDECCLNTPGYCGCCDPPLLPSPIKMSQWRLIIRRCSVRRCCSGTSSKSRGFSRDWWREIKEISFSNSKRSNWLVKKAKLDCYAETGYPITECLIWWSGELHLLVEILIFPFFLCKEGWTQWGF